MRSMEQRDFSTIEMTLLVSAGFVPYDNMAWLEGPEVGAAHLTGPAVDAGVQVFAANVIMQQPGPSTIYVVHQETSCEIHFCPTIAAVIEKCKEIM